MITKTRKKSKNQTRGVTLIALVITIIVLLILAGISIATLTSDNGLLKKARTSSEETKKSECRERLAAEVLGSYDENGKIDIEKVKQNLANNIGEDANILKESFNMLVTVGDYNFTITEKGEVVYTGTPNEAGNSIYTDNNGKSAVIPQGFRISSVEGENSIDSGLVIIDEAGNEFVWVPCDGVNTTYEKHEYLGTKPTTGDWENKDENGHWPTAQYRNYSDWNENLNKANDNKYSMAENIDSVANNGGFYIARYEAGIPSNAPFYGSQDGDAYNTDRNKENYVPVSKKNQPVWNYISQPVAKSVSQKMYGEDSSVKSNLIDGTAWDAATQWIAKSGKSITNSKDWGNYLDVSFTIDGLYARHKLKESPWGWISDSTYYAGNNVTITGRRYSQNEEGTTVWYRDLMETATGAADRNKANNIYDFAGNVYEWTTEEGNHDTGNTNSVWAVLRGGGFYHSGGNAASYRDGHGGTGGRAPYFGFRVVLYIK